MKRKNLETLEDLLDDASFRRWAAGDADEAGAYWEKWIREAPHREELVRQAVTLLKGLPFGLQEKALDPTLVQEEWNRLQSKTPKYLPGAASGPGRRNLRVITWGKRIAAGFAVMLVLGALLEFFVLNPLVEYRTPYGSQRSLVLPDSTAVNLNANSVLTYRRRNPRKIWLDGEAFFEVKKKPETGARFRVLTNDLTVEVLGTAFNVIEKKDKTEVVLEEGRVQLSLKRDFARELIMEPGDLVTFSANAGDQLEKRQVQPRAVTSWKDGVLEFKDVPLTVVMERIEAVYGWKPVYFNESLKTRKIYIDLPSEDLENAILLLSKAMDMQIEKVEEDGKVLFLR